MRFLSILPYATIVLALPAPETQAVNGLIYPYATYRYWVQTGKTIIDPQDQLLIVKNGNPADETTTIVTFQFDQSTQGKTCELMFELWDRDVSTGTQTLDVFTYSNPPRPVVQLTTTDIAQLVSAKSRDNHAGRIIAPKPGNATWIQSYQGWPKIPCPAGQYIGVEYVGAGDFVEVRWDIGVTGPRFRVL
ncbi:unnamed protein product [Clonostachys rhizophaga]|uniref:Ubiquitin 3 binding protein But2 C-terminal domain-containing protein n=1 Tax=Clonostachys rhizophaga TaxID=160324 RepID=A0A9N9VF86_9HYPO|nr:unnamed protein product [Clonostachys rhizophaga]